MKRIFIASMALAALAALALAGCGNGDDQKVTAEKVKKEAKQALDTAIAYGRQKQQEWLKQAEAQYQELKEQGDQLLEQAKQKAAQGQDKAQEALAQLAKQQEVVREKLKALQTASGKAWDKAKVELDQAMENLKQAYQKAKEELSG